MEHPSRQWVGVGFTSFSRLNSRSVRTQKALVGRQVVLASKAAAAGYLERVVAGKSFRVYLSAYGSVK